MAITILNRNDPRWPKGGPDVEDDQLARQQRAHMARVDEKEEFIKEPVTVSTGIKGPGGRTATAEIILRYPRSARIVEHKDDLDNVVKRERIWTNGKFVFATYGDNPDQHTLDRDVWEALARNAIEKFAAVHNTAIIFGPRQEDTNRYNIMAECRETIK